MSKERALDEIKNLNAYLSGLKEYLNYKGIQIDKCMFFTLIRECCKSILKEIEDIK